MNEGKYSSAADVYKEIIKYYPDDYSGYYGYICAATENFTKDSILKSEVRNLDKVREKLYEVSDGEHRGEYDKKIRDYLDRQYDKIQSRLENLDAQASRLHSEQVAFEQTSKKEYIDTSDRNTAKRIIAIVLIVLFSLMTLSALTFGIASFIVKIRVHGSFYFKVFTDLAIVISFLLMCIFAALTLAAIYYFIRTDRERIELEKRYSSELNKAADEYSKKSDEYQKEYQEIIKE